jgi:ribosomal-protein-alanine N-acetyltransferase
MNFEKLSKSHKSILAKFFEELTRVGDERYFHPHPFSPQAIDEIVKLSEEGIDEYWVSVSGENIIQYGILRGWREGYAIPSLGIATAPAARGQGLAKELMLFLHWRAEARGAAEIRLKVDRRNEAAIKLYESLGYVLLPKDTQNLVGALRLGTQCKR